MTIPVRIEYDLYRLTDATPWAVRDDYGFPESFGVGDGVVRLTTHPTISGYHVHTIQLFARQAQFDDPQWLDLLQSRALVLASAAYQQQYGQSLERVT